MDGLAGKLIEQQVEVKIDAFCPVPIRISHRVESKFGATG
jgi:hypothetical protein